MSQPLKQLSEVSDRCHSQGYLFGTFSTNYYQMISSRVHF